ncbi:alpha/beta fold hydrolase [Pseudonocardiaceae bacterium YIM PH 21723]|nr:alpha/beta fold hydrolase [Pseudonocardiaceae bacterium YIM PH 21723]
MTAAQPVGMRPAWVDDEQFPFTSRFVELDGNIVHYVDEGSGPILLMLHGNPVWSFVYREVIASLRDRFRCIALDFPGFGLSVGSPENQFLAQDQAKLLVSFIDALELSGLTLIGHDWGGPFGLHAATQRPDKVERLILNNTWAWALNGNLSSEMFSRVLGGSIGRALNKRFNLMVNYYVPSAHNLRKLSEAEMAHYRGATAPGRRDACAILPGELLNAREFFAELASRFHTIEELPTLILWGDKDPVFTDKYRERCEAMFPNHTTTVLHGVGHFGQSDAPEAFSDAIRRWFNES